MSVWHRRAFLEQSHGTSAEVSPEVPAEGSELNPETLTALKNLGYEDHHIENLNLPKIRQILKNQTPASQYKFGQPATPTASPIPKDHPLYDQAKAILEEVAVTDAKSAADAWDIYHTSRTAGEVATRLQSLPIPPHIAARLIEAKDSSQPKDVVDKILTTMMSIPKSSLDLAEAHPHVLDHFAKAALRKD